VYYHAPQFRCLTAHAMHLLPACPADLTLPNDRSFWSSGGHPSQVAHEALLYEVAGPACRVVSVKVAPYRALYQDG
jgi:hypothetical protein